MWGIIAMLTAWAIGYVGGYLSGRDTARRSALPSAGETGRARLDIATALRRPPPRDYGNRGIVASPRFTGMPPAVDEFDDEATR